MLNRTRLFLLTYLWRAAFRAEHVLIYALMDAQDAAGRQATDRWAASITEDC